MAGTLIGEGESEKPLPSNNSDDHHHNVAAAAEDEEEEQSGGNEQDKLEELVVKVAGAAQEGGGGTEESSEGGNKDDSGDEEYKHPGVADKAQDNNDNGADDVALPDELKPHASETGVTPVKPRPSQQQSVQEDDKDNNTSDNFHVQLDHHQNKSTKKKHKKSKKDKKRKISDLRPPQEEEATATDDGAAAMTKNKSNDLEKYEGGMKKKNKKKKMDSQQREEAAIANNMPDEQDKIEKLGEKPAEEETAAKNHGFKKNKKKRTSQEIVEETTIVATAPLSKNGSKDQEKSEDVKKRKNKKKKMNTQEEREETINAAVSNSKPKEQFCSMTSPVSAFCDPVNSSIADHPNSLSANMAPKKLIFNEDEAEEKDEQIVEATTEDEVFAEKDEDIVERIVEEEDNTVEETEEKDDQVVEITHEEKEENPDYEQEFEKEKETKKSYVKSNSIFTEQDTIVLLKQYLSSRITHGIQHDWVRFHADVKPKLSNTSYTKTQVSEKIRRLREKYVSNCTKIKKIGAVSDSRYFSDPHEAQVFDLSKTIWDAEVNINVKQEEHVGTGNKRELLPAISVNNGVKCTFPLVFQCFAEFQLGHLADEYCSKHKEDACEFEDQLKKLKSQKLQLELEYQELVVKGLGGNSKGRIL